MQIANLKYADPTNTLIDMDVTLDEETANQYHAAGETIPFCLGPDDQSSVSVAVRDLIAGGSYTVAAYVPPDAEHVAAALCAQVNAFRDARLAAGFADTETGKTWQCDADSIGKWTAIGSSAGLAMALVLSPAPTYQAIAADNSVATLSAADAFALFNGRVMPWVSATFLFARAMKDAINAGNAPADITAGWP